MAKSAPPSKASPLPRGAAEPAAAESTDWREWLAAMPVRDTRWKRGKVINMISAERDVTRKCKARSLRPTLARGLGQPNKRCLLGGVTAAFPPLPETRLPSSLRAAGPLETPVPLVGRIKAAPLDGDTVGSGDKHLLRRSVTARPMTR